MRALSHRDGGDILKSKISAKHQNVSKVYCNRQEVEALVKVVAAKIKESNKKYDIILGITNGGIIPAVLIGREIDIDHIQFIHVRKKELQKNEMPRLYKNKKYLVIDEIYDTGHTFNKISDALRKVNCDFAFLVSRYAESSSILVGKVLNHDRYVVFPWEKDDAIL